MDSKIQQYLNDFARSIKAKRLKESMIGGDIKDFIEVVKGDERLVLHIRNDYFNVYFRSGSLAKISNSLDLYIDDKYFNSDENVDDIKKLFAEKHYKEYIEKMIDVMNSYWKRHSKTSEDEGDVQQLISINNKDGKSDFDVLDLEYEVSSQETNPLHYDGKTPYSYKYKDKKTGKTKLSKKTKPRFDIVAVSKGKLFVIELKKGTGALRGHSGIHDHIDSYCHTIGKNAETREMFICEMKRLLEQKKDFGLINRSVEITNDDVEFCFAYAYKQPIKKRKFEIKSLNNIMNLTDSNGIKPKNYKTILLEPNEYGLFLKNCLKF